MFEYGFDFLDTVLKWLILAISTLNFSQKEWSNTSGLAIWIDTCIRRTAETSSHYYLKKASSRIYPADQSFSVQIARPEFHPGVFGADIRKEVP